MKRIQLNSSNKQLDGEFKEDVIGLQGFGSVGAIIDKEEKISVNPFSVESEASLKLTQKLQQM